MATTTQKEKVVRFRSRGRNFRAVMVPTIKKMGDFGSETIRGRTIEFQDGEYSTSDETEIAHLRGLPTLNQEFWELGNEPGAAPDSSEILAEAAQAALALDDRRLMELETQEVASFNRGDVVKAIRAMRGTVQAAG